MKPLIAITILSAVSFLCGNTITWLPLPTPAILLVVASILIVLAIVLLRWAMRVPHELKPGPRRYFCTEFTGTVNPDNTVTKVHHIRTYPVHFDEWRNPSEP